jgi:methyl-accepting chemotaxis protein
MRDFIAGICGPAKGLMAQFKYSIKFTVVSLIFLVPLILSLALLQYEYGDDIRFTRKELHGLEVIKQADQEMLLLANAKIRGLSSFSSKLSIDGKAYKEFANPQVSERFMAYKNSLSHDDLDVSFSALLSFVQSVADHSNLELDLELDTSYLVTTLVQTLPQAQQQLVATAAIARQVTEDGSFTPDTYISLSNANQKLPLVIANIQQSIGVSLAANKVINTQISGQWSALKQALDSYQAWIQTQILDPDEFTITPSEMINRSEKLNQAIFDFASIAMPVLKVQLEARISDANFKNNIVLTVSVLGVLLAIYLFIGMYLSVIENINRVVAAVHSIADGDLSSRVQVVGNDEMRDIANDMNQMTSNLEHLVARVSDAINTLSESAGSLKTVTEKTITGVQEQKVGTDLISSSMSTMTSVAEAVDKNSQVTSTSALDANQEARHAVGDSSTKRYAGDAARI